MELDTKQPTLMQVREFKPDQDYEMVSHWFAAHGSKCPPLAILPPLGIIVFRTNGFESEDLAGLWLYLAQASPVCFAEYAVTKPGLRLATTSLALVEAAKYFKFLVAPMGYSIMMAHTIPAIARYMHHADWYRGDEKNLIQMCTTIEDVCHA